MDGKQSLTAYSTNELKELVKKIYHYYIKKCKNYEEVFKRIAYLRVYVVDLIERECGINILEQICFMLEYLILVCSF